SYFLGVSVGIFAVMFLLAGQEPVEMGKWFGSAAIAFAALGSWASILSVGVVLTKRLHVPVLFLLIVVLWGTDLIWGDRFHEIDTVPRTTLWAESRDDLQHRTQVFHNLHKSGQDVPIVFVATAGGGLRAAYWTAMVLGALADAREDFTDQLF